MIESNEQWATDAIRALREAGYIIMQRMCSRPSIRPISDDGSIKEVRCGCGYSGFNAFGMEAEYERHRKQAEADADAW